MSMACPEGTWTLQHGHYCHSPCDVTLSSGTLAGDVQVQGTQKLPQPVVSYCILPPAGMTAATSQHPDGKQPGFGKEIKSNHCRQPQAAWPTQVARGRNRPWQVQEVGVGNALLLHPSLASPDGEGDVQN